MLLVELFDGLGDHPEARCEFVLQLNRTRWSGFTRRPRAPIHTPPFRQPTKTIIYRVANGKKGANKSDWLEKAGRVRSGGMQTMK